MHQIYQASKTYQDKYKSLSAKNILHLIGAVMLMFSTSACSIKSKTNSPMGLDPLHTGSVEKSEKPGDANPMDMEIIKAIVTQNENMTAKTDELIWNNPDTENSGTIITIDESIRLNGQKCKRFQTTVKNFAGVSLYDGETCKEKTGSWGILSFVRR